MTACPKIYEQASIKWMYVGQEGGVETITSAADIRTAMDEHASFPKRSPFWRFGLALDRQFNPRLAERSFVWSNIARIQKSDANGRVPSALLEFWRKQRMTAAEIEILRPQLVLFVTGPNYDDLLREEFPGETRQAATVLQLHLGEAEQVREKGRHRPSRNALLPAQLPQLAGPLGTPLSMQQRAMRHADIRQTMEYGDLIGDELRKANAKVVGQLIGSKLDREAS